jgi:serine/threonine-protein kinase
MSTVLGTTLSGRYRLEARIGAGGMSTVYRAVDETLERPVAIKLMNREVARDSDLLERFRREARAVAQLSHPNIVGVIDAGDDLDPDSPRPYIVFEYVEGETLKQRIRREGPLPIPEGVAYSIEIARALGAAHTRNIVHRDVKPQNVLIDRQGSAKVTDFGIARTLDEDGLTADGRVLGTTDYVSPEQALGQHVNGQSDLYSLGIALYEMLTGEVPFKGENQVAVAMKHVREPLPDVRAKRPEVSAALASVVEKATAKTTRERYASDAELIADLEQVLAVETARAGGATGEATAVLQSLPKGTRKRVPFAIRHRVRTIAIVVVLLLLAAAAIVWLATRAHNGNTPVAHHLPPSQLAQVTLSAATAYNPDGLNGDITQNNGATPSVIDGDTTTGWATQHYYSGSLQKPGVGIFVTAPRVAAQKLTVLTPTPGWSATIYATNTQPDLSDFQASDWVELATAASAGGTQRFTLANRGAVNKTAYTYYLVWITKLPPNQQYAQINEIKLFAPKR